MIENKPQITASSIEIFQKLQYAYNALSDKVKDRIESIIMGVSKPEFTLKKDFAEYTKIVSTDGIYSIEHNGDGVKICTEYGIFYSKVSEKGFNIEVNPYIKIN